MDEDEPKLIHLRDRVPELGDEHYANAVRIRDAKVYRFGSGHGERPISEAIAKGIPLAELAQAVATRQRLQKCTHRGGNTISRDTRLLTCDDCGMAWDPVDLLLKIAAGDLRTYSSLVNRKKLGAEIKALTAQRDDMARRAKNEKAKLARAKKSRDKVERLNDMERYELDRSREIADLTLAMQTVKRREITDDQFEDRRRLQGILMKLAEDRRGRTT